MNENNYLQDNFFFNLFFQSIKVQQKKTEKGPGTVFSKYVIILACENIILSFSKNLS